MKNYIATCVIAAAALASCTQTEDFTSQYNEKAKTMKFDVAYVGKNTRAATGDLTTQDLEKKNFILWGAAYQSSTPEATTGIWITDQEPLYFKKSTTTTYWEGYKEEDCSTTAEVTYPGSNYKTYFTAIAPSDEFASSPIEGKVNYTMAGQKSESTTPPSSSTRKLTLENIPVVQEINNASDSKEGTDYLIACHSGTQEEVALTFKHLLSKLRFAVWTDESTVPTTGGETTKITLTKLSIYLPNNNANAKYVQKAHDDVDGNWTWESGFTNSTTTPDETNYQRIEIYNESTGKNVKYFANATAAHDKTNGAEIFDKQYFIAPNGSSSCNLYIDIEYTVSRKKSDNSWTTSESEAGHKEVKRTKMAIPIKDGTHPDDSSNNEGLSHFHQGFIETLYICLRADQLVTFSTNFEVDKWVDDPIDINQ
ncbi:MAG: hypothetical protein Q4D64_09155 [Prevotellaceae bacterium]|nr:hypothetical protein [Prevotellaceae bacterium]